MITALIGVIIIIAAIIYSPWSYFGVFFLICLFSLQEFYKLVGLRGASPLKTFGTAIGLLLYTSSFLVNMDIITADYYVLLFPIFSFVFFIKLYKKSDKAPFTSIAYTFLGILYVGLPFALLNTATFSQNGYSWQIILGCLLLLWATDTGAYFAGTYFGKTKLFERISPKKSWEGSLGGAILAFAIAFGLTHYFQDLEDTQWYVMAVIMVVAGTYGDLVESLFKRGVAIKDSGNSIPGHGGFLDRFDGLFLSAPFIMTFLELF